MAVALNSGVGPGSLNADVNARLLHPFAVFAEGWAGLFLLDSPTDLSGDNWETAVVLSAGAFQPERRAFPEPAWRRDRQRLTHRPREIPPPAGENAGVRDDAAFGRKRERILPKFSKIFRPAVDFLRAERL